MLNHKGAIKMTYIVDETFTTYRNNKLKREKRETQNRNILYVHACVRACLCLHSSNTIKIDVAENRLHHGLIEPLQRLQTERQIV